MMMMSSREHLAIMVATVEAYLAVIGDAPIDIAYARDNDHQTRSRLMEKARREDPARFEVHDQLTRYAAELHLAIMVAEIGDDPYSSASAEKERQLHAELKEVHQQWSYYWL